MFLEIGMNILVIEDDEVIAELVRMGLEEARFTVDVARDGTSGLQQALEGEYGLIVLDLMLPGRTAGRSARPCARAGGRSRS